MGSVRGISGIAKREEVVDVFRMGKFELLALSETNLKEKGKVSWCRVNGIFVREGVAV